MKVRVLANIFALSKAEVNNSGPLNKGGVADLPLLRNLLAIFQKSDQPRFLKVIDTKVWQILEHFDNDY